MRVLVVDDCEPWLRFIRSMLQQAWDLQVVGEASDGQEAVQKALQLQPDLILLDIGLPTLNGIEAARKIRKHNPHTKIIFVSEQRAEDVVQAALSTGSGYVVKFNAARELLPAIKALFDGEAPKTIEKHHEVNSYPDKAAFVEAVTRFVGTGLENGRAIVVLAGDSHRSGILQSLKSEGVDVAAAIEQKRYFPFELADGFHTFQFTEYLATDAVRIARERNLRVGVV